MSVTKSLMYRKLFTCPCKHGQTQWKSFMFKGVLARKWQLFSNWRFGGQENSSTMQYWHLKKPLTMMQSWFLTFLLLNKSSDSTLHHQELSPNERQEVSVLSSLSCWAWCWWGINSRLQIANAWRLPPATKKSSESNRIRSATQRAWVLDLEASSRREGISTKTSPALSHGWKKWHSNFHSCVLKIRKKMEIWNNKRANCVAITTLISIRPQLQNY